MWGLINGAGKQAKVQVEQVCQLYVQKYFDPLLHLPNNCNCIKIHRLSDLEKLQIGEPISLPLQC